MSKTTVTFNGTTLNDDFIVSDFVRPFLMRSVNTTQVDGRNGAIYRSSSYDPIEVSMCLTFVSEDKNARVKALANLVKALDVDEPAQLAISDDNGWYYLAVPKGGSISRWIGAESFPLTFICPEPARYGEHRRATLLGAVRTVTVGGNFDTPPKLTYAIKPSFGYANIAICQDSDTYSSNKVSWIQLHFPDNELRYIIVDCATRTVTAKTSAESSYSVIVPEISTEFPILGAGNRVYLYGVTVGTLSGSFYIEYDERWL